MRLPRTLLVGALLWASPMSVGRAQAPEAAASPAASDRDRAIRLFEASREAYRAGRFREAAVLLRRAYALDPAPTLLYNLARALESDGDIEGAAAAYRDYLRADPSAEDRAAIERRIENLESQLAEREELRRRLDAERARKADAEAGPVDVVAPAPPPPGASPAPWIVAGIGGAGLAAGAVLGGLAQSRHGSAEDASSQSDAVALEDEARGLARGANVAFVAGGVVAAAGVVWGVIDLLGADEGEPLTVAPTLGPRGLGVVGRF